MFSEYILNSTDSTNELIAVKSYNPLMIYQLNALLNTWSSSQTLPSEDPILL